MTQRRRRVAHSTAVVRFLLEDFVEVPDGETGFSTDTAAVALAKFQARAARILLPGPAKGAFSTQQLMLVGLQRSQFQNLRRDVRQWLRSLATFSGVGHTRTLHGKLTLSLVSVPGKPDRLQAPIVEGEPLDVFWYYLTHLMSRVGLTRIGVCHAPKSKREPGQMNPELGGRSEPCGRLFLRRGRAKQYCSDRCRARVATQRARAERKTR